MAAGLPIASCNSSSIPEILRDASIYFNLENPTEIETGLEALILNPDLRGDLAQKAY